MPETAAPPDPRTVLHERTRPITVDEYHKMGKAGLFAHDERVELLGGHLITMSPVGYQHFYCINRLNMLITRRIFEANVAEEPTVSVQGPVRLNQTSEPEPDVAVLSPDAPETRMPAPHEVLLLIEVAHSSLEYDDGPKRILYAEADIPVYWIVDVENETVDVLTAPENGAYTKRHSFERGDAVPLPDPLPGEPIPVDDILGAPARDSSGEKPESDAGETE